MNVGKLRNRITIYSLSDPETEVDVAGQSLDEPVEVAKIWAAIVPLRGRELESARQLHGEVTTRIETRYREGLTPSMFARLKNKDGSYVEFEFLYLIQVNYAKKELHIFAKEIQHG